MDVVTAVKIAETSTVFKTWKQKNTKAFLSYCFTTIEHGDAVEWQVGYYDMKSDTITPFTVNKTAEKGKEDTIFKKPDAKVQKLDMSLVKISLKNAVVTMDKIEEYKTDMATKIIVLLQDIDSYGVVWNLTALTPDFHTVNVKIDANTGEVKHTERVNLLGMPGK